MILKTIVHVETSELTFAQNNFEPMLSRPKKRGEASFFSDVYYI
jgi:hypothetical protein